jgi:anti-sigma regulatory factor (Ser/Thr protein kinase)
MCGVTPAVTEPLPTGDHAPRAARALLLAQGCAEHHGAVLADAQLLVSELVTNAVRHGAPPIVLRIECDESLGLQVSVSDGSKVLPQRKEVGGAAVGGRGLTLVDLLSDQWGIESGASGKQVWFRLRRSE